MDAEAVEVAPMVRARQLGQTRWVCTLTAPVFLERKTLSARAETGLEEVTREQVSGKGVVSGEQGASGVTCRPRPASPTASRSLPSLVIRLPFFRAVGDLPRRSRPRLGSIRH